MPLIIFVHHHNCGNFVVSVLCAVRSVPVNVDWLKRDLRRLLLPGVVARQSLPWLGGG